MVCQCTINAVAYAALAYVAFRVFRAVYAIAYPYLVASPPNLKKLAGADFAVVTGSTDGIGKEYAFQLAKQGFNLVLVSRSAEKLQTTKAEIQEKHSNVEVRTITFDFTQAGVDSYRQNLVNELQDIQIGVLVNNVGLSYNYPESLHKVAGGLERIADITVINTLPVTLLSAAVLPQMVKRRAGVIVNISSSASRGFLRYWAVYSATKKYVNHLTEILRREYASEGITVQTVLPMMVSTKMSKVRTSFFAPNAATFAASAIRTIGVVSETTGCLAHEIQSLVFSLPDVIVDHITTSNSVATRAAALRKLERQAKAQ